MVDRGSRPATNEPGLRFYRLRAGLTQEELASRAEVSVRGVANIEHGRVHRPHLYTLRRLADALGLSDGERDRFLHRRPRPAAPARAADARGAGHPTADGFSDGRLLVDLGGPGSRSGAVLGRFLRALGVDPDVVDGQQVRALGPGGGPSVVVIAGRALRLTVEVDDASYGYPEES